MLETATLIQCDHDLSAAGLAGDDQVVPFAVESLDVRGRAVQLGPVLDRILSRHDYPEPVARLLAEAAALTVLLGSLLKFEGKFILQTRSDGPVDMLVADFSTPHCLRAYARFDRERLEAAIAEGRSLPEQLMGRGTLALTIDQGSHTQRYQGIVQLDGVTLEEAAMIYFRQSEQLPTDIRLSVARMRLPGESVDHWRAGGILAQFLPDAPERMRLPDLHGGDGDESATFGPDDNAWQELLALFGTIEPSELVDPSVGVERLLYRLFHEHGARVFESIPARDECSCSREKIRGILDSFTAEEIADSIEEGVISVKCQFCSVEYEFDPAEFAEIQ